MIADRRTVAVALLLAVVAAAPAAAATKEAGASFLPGASSRQPPVSAIPAKSPARPRRSCRCCPTARSS